jgi:hypothetical protein
MPVNMPAVREADAARLRRRKPLGEERNKRKKLKLGGGGS